MELSIEGGMCRLLFDRGSILKSEGASIFDPEARFAPALLTLSGLRSISCEGAKAYQLNCCVVGFRAAVSNESDYIEFAFDLTGGIDPDSFMVKVTFVAKNFEFGPFSNEQGWSRACLKTP